MKYSIEDLRNGKVAVINDGTIEELREVLRLAFPDDHDVPHGDGRRYRVLTRVASGRWTSAYNQNLPAQSVKDFLPKEEVKQQPIIAIQGYEIDEASSTDSKIVYRKIRVIVPSEPVKPEIKSWEDLEKIDGYYISDESEIMKQHGTTESDIDKNVFPSESEAEAMLAMAQLCQLRDRVNDGWKPDWRDSGAKYCICAESNELIKNTLHITNTTMAFRSPAVRDMFMVDFKELLTIAIPFL